MRTAITVGTAAAVIAGTVPALAANTPEGTVTVGRPTVTIQPGALGADEPFWNGELLDHRSPQLMRRAGIRMLDFDAGGPIDLYHWKTNSLSPNPGSGANPLYAALKPEFSFDQFERIAKSAGATTMVHVNYGTGPDSTTAKPTPGDPAEAAAWVQYANRTRHYGVKYWTVGEETYLDSIGEPDAHTAKTPQEYGKNLLEYAKHMKKADPTIKVGAEMWAVDPADIKGSSQQAKFFQRIWKWDQALLKTKGIGREIDFVDIHWLSYGGLTDAQMLDISKKIRPALGNLRNWLNAIPGGRHTRILAGEVNSAVAGAPQQSSLANALYLADNETTLLEQGAVSVHWWALHNGPQGDDQHGVGDLAMLSSGACDEATDICQPPAQTPFPSFYGQQITGEFARTGGQLLRASSSVPAIRVHALREPDGGRAIMLINTSPTASTRLKVPALKDVTMLQYGQGSHHVDRSHLSGRVDSVTVPPFSITVLAGR